VAAHGGALLPRHRNLEVVTSTRAQPPDPEPPCPVRARSPRSAGPQTQPAFQPVPEKAFGRGAVRGHPGSVKPKPGSAARMTGVPPAKDRATGVEPPPT
jgi:hypothetical protein